MKNTFILIAVLALLTSCQKETHISANEEIYLENVIASLRDSLTATEFATLDFSKIIESKVKDDYIVRLGVKSKSISNYFVVLKTTKEGKIMKGLNVHIEKDTLYNRDKTKYNGFITLSSLNKKPILSSKIVNGFIVALHNSVINQRSLVEPRPNNVLPEVVVTCYVSSSRSTSVIDMINLWSLLGGNYNIYNPINGSTDGGYAGGGSYGGGGSGGGTWGSADGSILIDYEPDDIPAIDIDKFIKCFTNISDMGLSALLKY
jgi:hypothetical protein